MSNFWTRTFGNNGTYIYIYIFVSEYIITNDYNYSKVNTYMIKIVFG